MVMRRYILFCAFMSLMLMATSFAHAGILVDNGDDTISDQGTHLMWQKQDDGTTKTWYAAITYCEGLTLAGHTDWRLPTIKELKSIFDMTKYNPAINTTYFPGAQSNYCWSSTTNKLETSRAWQVTFLNGQVSYHFKTLSYNARCVR